jgi:regulator of RNase E activity RraB
VSPSGGPSCHYNILLTKVKLAKDELADAEKYCVEALQYDYQVRDREREGVEDFEKINNFLKIKRIAKRGYCGHT